MTYEYTHNMLCGILPIVLNTCKYVKLHYIALHYIHAGNGYNAL